MAAKNFARVAELRSWLTEAADPQAHAESNVLLVIDFGHGPQKVTNPGGAVVGFVPTPEEEGPVPQPVVEVDAEPIHVEPVARPPSISGLAQTVCCGIALSAREERVERADGRRAAMAPARRAAIGAGCNPGRCTPQASAPADVRRGGSAAPDLLTR